jgi:UDP-perosamine 4-acetyltransferase
VRLLIVGCGAQGRVILDILRAARPAESIEFIDDDPQRLGQSVNGAVIAADLRTALAWDRKDVEVIVALGNPEWRTNIGSRFQASGFSLCNAIHPSAVVMPGVVLGGGNMVGATAVVNTDARIGNHVIINTGAVVEHDCVLEDGSAVSPGANLGGRVTLREHAFVGTGAIVLSRVNIGAGSVVAAGSVVTRDVPERVLVKGIPARIVEGLDQGFDWKRVL